MKSCGPSRSRSRRYSFTVAAGDLVGASPLVSAAFHDEPVVEEMNSLGLDVTSVGNHEFDEGVDGAATAAATAAATPPTAARTATASPAPTYPMLAANVVYKKNHRRSCGRTRSGRSAA